MKTSKMWINGTVRRNDEVNDILRDFAAEAGIAGRDYQHMCLLTEETLGMAHDSLKNLRSSWKRTCGKARKPVPRFRLPCLGLWRKSPGC